MPGRNMHRWTVLAAGTVIAATLGLAVLLSGPDRALAADASGVASVTVRMATVGRERTPGQTYALEARCATADGAVVPPAPTAGPQPTAPISASTTAAVLSLPFRLAADATRVLGPADFPTLTPADSCTIRVTPAEGAEISYRSSQPTRADGSVPDAVAGVLQAGGYHAAPARANGQVVTVTLGFNGDVVLNARIGGSNAAPPLAVTAAPSVLAVELRCDSGFLQSARMIDGQTQLFTGVPVGAVCRVTEHSGAGARFADNSGDPNDGIVTVVATPSSCWDLRVVGPECRVTITVTAAAAPGADADVTATTSATTTTSPSTTVAPATTAAPAVTPAPATPVEAEPAFTG